MTTAIFSQVTGQVVDALRRLLEEHQGMALKPREVREALALCLFIRDLFRHTRSALKAVLSEGVEGGAFRSMCTAAVASARGYLEVEGTVRNIVHSGMRGFPPNPTAAAELALGVEEIEAFRKEYQDVLDFVNRSCEPIDIEHLRAIEAANPPESDESIEDILARLEAGGDI